MHKHTHARVYTPTHTHTQMHARKLLCLRVRKSQHTRSVGRHALRVSATLAGTKCMRTTSASDQACPCKRTCAQTHLLIACACIHITCTHARMPAKPREFQHASTTRTQQVQCSRMHMYTQMPTRLRWMLTRTHIMHMQQSHIRVCWRAPTCVSKTREPDMHARRQRNHSIMHNHTWMCIHACVNECLRVPSNVHKPLWGRTLICAHIMNITHARARKQAGHAQTHVHKAAHTATHACYHPCTHTHTRVEQAQTHRHIHTGCMQAHIMTNSSTQGQNRSACADEQDSA